MKKVTRVILSLALVASLSLTSFAVVKSDKLSKLKNQKAAAELIKTNIRKRKAKPKSIWHQ
ncbi:MAG: hypothetical protein IJ883_05240 [Eubacterium sp.]|nr:hypothetical protein [Eubacterium sp.]